MRQHRPLFRKEALDRLSAPDRLDQALQIVEPRDWVAVSALGGLLALALVWSVVGSVPTAVTARGVVTHPRRVVPIEAPASGPVSAIHVRPDDRLTPGALIATLDQPEITKALEQERAALETRIAQDLALSALERRQTELRNAELDLELRNVEHLRQSRARHLQDAEALALVLRRRMDARRRLLADGLIPAVSDDLLEAEQAIMANEARRADLALELRRIDLQRAQVHAARQRLAYEVAAAAAMRRNELEEATTRVAVLAEQLRRDGGVRSVHGGRLLELVAHLGQVVSAGDRLAAIEVDGPGDGSLVGLGYFPVGDGRRIQPGMRVQVTPDMVERARHGGMVGVVASVSPFPVTSASAASALGNAELAGTLTAGAALIEILIHFEADPTTPSGYKWSSAGSPDLRLSPGTTASVRVMVEGRRPITYVLPFLRAWSGIY